MNPYLQKERTEEYKTFSETITPSTIARGLLSICAPCHPLIVFVCVEPGADLPGTCPRRLAV